MTEIENADWADGFDTGDVAEIDTVLARIDPAQFEARLHPSGDTTGRQLLVEGSAASPGLAVGHAYFSADAALDAADQGEEVVLIRTVTDVGDEPAMRFSQAIVTARGGFASHAAVVARAWGVPAVCGAVDLRIYEDHAVTDTARIDQGDLVTVDGDHGQVFIGEVAVAGAADATGKLPLGFERILAECDRVLEGRVSVHANADVLSDFHRATAFGADGIGLCRTEQFFAGDRLSILTNLVLATTEEEQAPWREQLVAVHRETAGELLEAAGGRPVVVRLLDAPVHEFFPRDGDSAGVPASLVETNPMLGVRGVRLGVVRPDIYAAQIRGLVLAAADDLARRDAPADMSGLSILIPMVMNRGEIEFVRGLLVEVVDELSNEVDSVPHVRLGAMVETPRAALLARDLAQSADFLSFGTNDLTQMTFGISRDDVDTALAPAYHEAKIWEDDPFQVLDVAGVAALITRACRDAWDADPMIETVACGEHAGNPASIARLIACGVRVLSCSPYRVPVAKLVAAQALLASR